MAYGKLQIRIRQVSSLRGDQKTKDGEPTDGGYARKSFFVETHLEGETFSPNDMKKAIVSVCKPEILRALAGASRRAKK